MRTSSRRPGRSDFALPSRSHGRPPKPVLSERFGAALGFAVSLHRRQSRKGTRIPYASHLLAVAATVLEHGGSEREAIAALLHDAIEDQAGRDPAPLKHEIKKRFGKAVLDIVLACSDAETSVKKPPWKERKLGYITHLAKVSDSVLLVSIADKIHNARAILRDYGTDAEALWSRFNGGREGTLWYYRQLVEAFRARGRPVLVAELDATVSELERRAAAR